MPPSVLFVDDDVDTRMMIEIALGLRGFEVLTVASGSEALVAANTRTFDLFILDNWMPEMTGVTLCAQLRNIHKYTPIIFLSGAGRYDDKSEATAAGADCYLTKPVDLDVLHERLTEWVSRQHVLV